MNEKRLEQLADAMVNDMGAALSCALARVGDRLGLYRALADQGATDAARLAASTGLSERMLQEWLVSQAAAGYISYDPRRAEYSLSPEQAALLADERGSRFLMGGFQFASALVKAEERVADSFRHGKGLAWAQQHSDLPTGVGRFLKPGYMTELASTWVPAVPGLRALLRKGVAVADVGCGYGYSTVALARAFPKSTFYGFDSHAPSIAACRALAAEEGLGERAHFDTALAHTYPLREYGVVAYFNTLHDVGQPQRALAHARAALAPKGMLLLTEPMAGHTVQENFNPVGRVMSGSSVLCCTPHGISDGGDSLGTLVTDARLAEVALAAGFGTFERVFHTKYTRIFVGRP